MPDVQDHGAQIRALWRGQELLTNQMAELVVEMRAMRAEVPSMMADGIRAAVGDPETWAAAKRAMSEQAQSAAGGWLLGMLRFAVDKVVWAMVALVAVYWAGGFPALMALLKLNGSDR